MRKQMTEEKHVEIYEDNDISQDLVELHIYLDQYSVRYPDDRTISTAIEQLRKYVPEKRHRSLTRMAENLFRLLPVYRFTSITILFIGCLFLPNKLY